MCHKFLPHFEIFNENFYIFNFIFQKIKKNLPRKCAGAYPNAEILHNAICKRATFYRATCKIAVYYRAVYLI